MPARGAITQQRALGAGELFRRLGRPSKLLGYGAFVVCLLLMVDAALPRLEMLITGGSVPVPTIILKASLAFLLILGTVARLDLRSPYPVLLLWGALLLALLLNFGYLRTVTDLRLEYQVFSYDALYLYLLVVPLLFSVRGTVRLRLAERCWLLVGLFLTLLGVMQGLLQEPLLATASTGGYFQLRSWNYFGQVRAFSLFSSGARFGAFLVVYMPFCVAAGLRRKGGVRLIYLAGAGIGALATYLTLTRAVYLWVALSLCTLFVVSVRELRAYRMLVLPCYLAVGTAVAFAAPEVGHLVGAADLGSTHSMLMRYSEWRHWTSVWLGNGWSTLLGTGLIQNNRFAVTKGILVDNTFLAVALQGGILALAVVVILFCWMTKYLFDEASATQSPLAIGLACAFSTWPAAAMFNIVLSRYSLVFFLGVLLRSVCLRQARKPTVLARKGIVGSGRNGVLPAPPS